MAKPKRNPDSFEARWIRRQHECGQDELGPPEFVTFEGATLPTECAPFLTFEEAADVLPLWKVFG